MTERYEISEKKPLLAFFFGLGAAENLPFNILLLELTDNDVIDFSLIGTELSTVFAVLTWLSFCLAIAGIVLSTGALKSSTKSKGFCIAGLVLSILSVVCDLTVMPLFILMASCSESCSL